YTVDGSAQLVGSGGSPVAMVVNNPSVGINLHTGGEAHVKGCDLVGFGEGIRLTSGNVVQACRFEMNIIGIRVGAEASGDYPYATGSAMVAGCDFEANTTTLQIESCSNSLFTALGHTGDTNCGSQPLDMTITNASWASNTATITTNGKLTLL